MPIPRKDMPVAGEILQGNLELLILRTLLAGRAHGHTIAEVIDTHQKMPLRSSRIRFTTALHWLEDRGLLASEWG